MHNNSKIEQAVFNYFDILNRGGLTEPSELLFGHVCSSFAILDTAHDILIQYSNVIRNAALPILDYHQNEDLTFLCSLHNEWGRKNVNNIVTNIFFNNEQKIKTSEIRKDQVVEIKSRQCKQKL